MAPLPPDSTARLWIDYECGSYDHSVQIRLADGVPPSQALDDFTTLIDAIGASFYASSVIGARYAASGSNVSNPIAGGWPVGWGSDTPPRIANARMLNFVGRSLDGRRTAVKLLGCRVESSGDDFRVTTAEGSMVNAAVAALNAMEGTFVTINGFQPVWKNYANIGDNAYWRNHIR